MQNGVRHLMKVLWLCNLEMSEADPSGTGTWLAAMARGLIDSGDLQLGVISEAPVGQITRRDCQGVSQWLVPRNRRVHLKGLPSAAVVRDILAAGGAFVPDLIHVWGTESYWGLLTARHLLQAPALLEMQGLKMTIADEFYGGLSLRDRLRCIGIKEILKRRSMYRDRLDFTRWGILEREMILGHNFIDVQSPWIMSRVQAVNPKARIFKSDRALRNEFECADSWQSIGKPVVFTTAAYPSPFKGLHVAVRAMAALRRHFPDASLRIAGAHQRIGIRQEGYIRWINALIRELGLEGHIEWLGPLPADRIVKELQMAGAALIPTFVESYCVAMAEAMRVGTPTVAAFTGGTSHLGRDEETCLFFPPGDAAMCAFQLERLFKDSELARRLSQQARQTAAPRHNRRFIAGRQVETYREILAESSKTE
jgi:glycosyltransferase involved in cell wall biosynthesis